MIFLRALPCPVWRQSRFFTAVLQVFFCDDLVLQLEPTQNPHVREFHSIFQALYLELLHGGMFCTAFIITSYASIALCIYSRFFGLASSFSRHGYDGWIYIRPVYTWYSFKTFPTSRWSTSVPECVCVCVCWCVQIDKYREAEGQRWVHSNCGTAPVCRDWNRSCTYDGTFSDFRVYMTVAIMQNLSHRHHTP